MTYLASIQSELNQIEQNYTLREREKVLAFLDQHPFLVPLLIETRPKIEKYFQGRPVFLELEVDPELIGVVELSALVSVVDDEDKVSEQLSRFIDDWGVEMANRANFLLTVSVEFQ